MSEAGGPGVQQPEVGGLTDRRADAVRDDWGVGGVAKLDRYIWAGRVREQLVAELQFAGPAEGLALARRQVDEREPARFGAWWALDGESVADRIGAVCRVEV